MGKEWLIKNGTKEIDSEINRLLFSCQSRCLTLKRYQEIVMTVIRLKFKRRFLIEKWLNE